MGDDQPKPKRETFADPERARARIERVDEVLGMLTRGARSTRVCAEKSREWGVGLHTVQEYVREASTVLKYVVLGDPEDIRAQIVAGIEDIRRRCREKTRSFVLRRGEESELVEVPDPDLKTALASYEAVAKACGIVVTKVQEVPADTKPEETLEALEAAAKKLREAIEAKRGGAN